MTRRVKATAFYGGERGNFLINLDSGNAIKCYQDRKQLCDSDCARYQELEDASGATAFCGDWVIGDIGPIACAPREEHEQPAPGPASDLEP
jgi:hypothetical protein